MDANSVLDFIRGLVRPAIQYALAGTLIWLTIWLAQQFADAEMAKYVVFGVVGAGLTMLGVYAGGRATKKPE